MLRTKFVLAFIAGMATMIVGTTLAQQYGSVLFPDVLPTDYFADAVNRFARKSIVTGYKNGRFGPHDYVTRGQTAVILDRYDQQVIRRLREQVEAMRFELGMGRCGDGTAQIGEACDDGNTLSGDGCSTECLQEIHCSGGYKVGDRYPAPDGCNICTCTEAGIACTERACTQKKCFSTAECVSGEVCSVEEGDCRYPCPQGAVCIQACAGVCIPKAITSICGDGVCEETETAVPTQGGQKVYCPQDCSITGPVCGNAKCEDGEADEYRFENGSSILIRRGTCPTDCEGGLSACEQTKKSIDVQFQQNLSCQTDADCAVFVRGCSPYQTCGKAIRKDALLKTSAAVFDYVEACEGSEPALCAGCLPVKAVCVNNVCKTQQ